MKNYFILSSASGDLRLIPIGKFDYIGQAMDYADSRFSEVIWVLAEDDVLMLLRDYNACF